MPPFHPKVRLVASSVAAAVGAADSPPEAGTATANGVVEEDAGETDHTGSASPGGDAVAVAAEEESDSAATVVEESDGP